MDKVKRFKEIAEVISEMYENKNADYGDSFGKTYKELGPVSGITRMEDKFNRIKSLILGDNKKANYESIVDTLDDLAAYSIMMHMEMEDSCEIEIDEETAQKIDKMSDELVSSAKKYFKEVSNATIKDMDYVVNTITSKEEPKKEISGAFVITNDGDEISMYVDNGTKHADAESTRFAEALEEFITKWFDTKCKEDGSKK